MYLLSEMGDLPYKFLIHLSIYFKNGQSEIIFQIIRLVQLPTNPESKISTGNK